MDVKLHLDVLDLHLDSTRQQRIDLRGAWYGMVWYGMVWYGMVWYGAVWYGNSRHARAGQVSTTTVHVRIAWARWAIMDVNSGGWMYHVEFRAFDVDVDL